MTAVSFFNRSKNKEEKLSEAIDAEESKVRAYQLAAEVETLAAELLERATELREVQEDGS